MSGKKIKNDIFILDDQSVTESESSENLIEDSNSHCKN